MKQFTFLESEDERQKFYFFFILNGLVCDFLLKFGKQISEIFRGIYLGTVNGPIEFVVGIDV
jgi:hypothetical protein